MVMCYHHSTLILVRLQLTATTVCRSRLKLPISKASGVNVEHQQLLIAATKRSMMVESNTLHVRPAIQRGVGLSVTERAAIRESRRQGLNDAAVKEVLTKSGVIGKTETTETSKKSLSIITYAGVATIIGISVVASTGKIKILNFIF
jgi:hypothetical protein